MKYILQSLRIRDVLLIHFISILPGVLVNLYLGFSTYFCKCVYLLLFLVNLLVVCKGKGEKLSEIKTLFESLSWKQIIKQSIALFCFSLATDLIISCFWKDVDTLHESILDYICFYLYATFLGPISEEITFRGIILNRLSKKVGVNKAIIYSSLIFAILHYCTTQYLYTFVFGIICSLLYLQSRNLMLPIAVHVLTNSVLVIFGFSFPNITDNVTQSESLLIGAILLIPSLVYILSYIKNNWRSAIQSMSDIHESSKQI